MTNILATIAICLVTNVTDYDNSYSGCPEYVRDNGTMNLCMYNWCTHRRTPATEKVKRIEIVEVKRLAFVWENRTEAVEHRKVLSSKVQVWKLEEKWVEKLPCERTVFGPEDYTSDITVTNDVHIESTFTNINLDATVSDRSVITKETK